MKVTSSLIFIQLGNTILELWPRQRSSQLGVSHGRFDGMQKSIKEWLLLVGSWWSEHLKQSRQAEQQEQLSDPQLTTTINHQNVVKHSIQAFSSLLLDWNFSSWTNSELQHAWEETRWWWSILVQLPTLQLQVFMTLRISLTFDSMWTSRGWISYLSKWSILYVQTILLICTDL